VPQGEQEIVFLSGIFSGLWVAQSLVLCVVFTTIATPLKYRVLNQTINICLDNYYMY
jgi:hypothetical protein